MKTSWRNCFIALVIAGLPVSALALSRPPVIILFGIGNEAPESGHALRHVRRAIERSEREVQGSAAYVIAGHTDRAGSYDDNVRLSCIRAQAVRAVFVAEGVPADRFVLQAFGETRPAVDTEDGESEPSNRRVEITFQPAAWDRRQSPNCT